MYLLIKYSLVNIRDMYVCTYVRMYIYTCTYVRMYVYICTYVCMGVAKNPVWLGIDMLIYHWTSLAKNLNGAKRFDDYTVVIVSGNTKQRRCSFKYTMGR